jgi:hypothetical protein
MCLRRAPEKYIAGAKAPAGAALDRAALKGQTRAIKLYAVHSVCIASNVQGV